MKKHGVTLLLFLWFLSVKSQLLPGIGLNAQPSNTATICAEPFYLGSFYASGYHQGDTVPDFKLFGLSGDSLVLSQELLSGKPVLLIGGSLTCPVFRARVATINQVAATYSSLINVYVIYTLEAHPTDTSVYFGYVNVTSQNTSAGILFHQPKTYAARKTMVDTMNSFVTLNAAVFIDGPCNNWWKNFGPAPNNSYLIGTNGVVLNKQGWFHKYPDNIFCDLDSILNMASGLCNQTPAVPGSFSLSILNGSVSGNPGDLLYDFVNIVNTTSVTTVVKVKKLQNLLPPGWQTMFCADICYSAADDSIEIFIDAFDTLNFSLDFLTSNVPDSGSVRVGFKNTNKPNNAFSIWLKANTIQNEVAIAERIGAGSEFLIYPNPATHLMILPANADLTTFSLFDASGKRIPISPDGRTLDLGQVPGGIYFAIFETTSGHVSKKLIVEK